MYTSDFSKCFGRKSNKREKNFGKFFGQKFSVFWNWIKKPLPVDDLSYESQQVFFGNVPGRCHELPKKVKSN